mgnify:FL=1
MGFDKNFEPFYEVGLMIPGGSNQAFYVDLLWKWPWQKKNINKDCPKKEQYLEL